MRPGFLLAMLCACTPPASAEPALTVAGLTVNGRVDPLGIPADNISFGWSLASTARGAWQSARQIRVGTAPGLADVWDSDRVATDTQVDATLPASVVLAPATLYSWQVKTWNQHGVASDWSAPARFETGLLSAADWGAARWITAPAAPGSPLPLLRREFNVPCPVTRARLYASALGLYQLSFNGHRVGDQFLAPGWTDYHQRIQSQTYDVTTLVQTGANVLGAALGDGWYRGQVGLGWTKVYGDELAFIARLRLTYVDGSEAWFDTDANWRQSTGPRMIADLQNGEHHDARLEQPGWDAPGFNASAWPHVSLLGAAPRGRLVPQPDEPVRAVATLGARSRTEPAPGEYVYDLGQNLVGVARVRLNGRTGQTIHLRHAEELQRTGPQIGRLYTDNLRKARATDTYTFARDGMVTFQPVFTQHGFRYLEITGADTPPAITDVEAVVLSSDLPAIGDLRTDHAMLNQLVSNIRWGQRGNFLSIPTDTPARDERLGWTGDINVFAPAAARFADTRAFLSKWMTDVRDAQKPDGNLPAVVPQPRREFDSTGVGWPDAIITVPHSVWRATGDLRIVRENWAAMRAFLGFVHASATADGDLLEQGRSNWFSGDWLSLEKVDRLQEHRVIATAYFAENTRLMAELARALGESGLAAEWTALVTRIRAAFVAAYVDADGAVYTGTQTAYALALGMDMIDDPAARQRVAARFVAKLAADDYHLRTGFLGTPWLLPALSRIGRDDLAMRLLLNDTYPSWGFPISLGATTMWERWNSVQPNLEFGPVDMNSFNHYAYGAVGDWMFQKIGGLHALEPGYKKSLIAPLLDQPRVPGAVGTLRTPYGLLACDWRATDDQLTVAVEVPVNTTAEIHLPTLDPDTVLEGDSAARSAPGVTASTFHGGRLILTVGSGRYLFTAPRSTAP
jgi:alpha-L-rhamnosidase